MQNKYHFFVQGQAQKGLIMTLYHNSALGYAVALNFGRNGSSMAFNSNWYNLASMLQYNVFWKPFYVMLIN